MTRREEVELAWLNKAVQSNHRYDEKSFKEAVEWADKTMIEKACEWVENHIFDFPWYDNEHGDFSSKDVANALRKAMEE